jgi:hypothetical protein
METDEQRAREVVSALMREGRYAEAADVGDVVEALARARRGLDLLGDLGRQVAARAEAAARVTPPRWQP